MTTKIIRQFLVWFITTGAIVGVAVWGWNVEKRFVADAVPVPSLEGIEELRAGPNGMLAVAAKTGARVTVHRFTPARTDAGEQSFLLQAEDDSFAIFPDASRIVSAHDRTVRLSPLQDAGFLGAHRDLKADLSDVAVSESRLVLASAKNGDLHVLNPNDLSASTVVKLPFQGDSRLQTSGSYVAVIASDRTQFAVYDLRDALKPKMSEYRKTDLPFDGAILSASGRMMLAQPSSLTAGGKILPTPGFVRAAAALDAGHLIITGDFPGIYRLSMSGAEERIAPSPSGGTVVTVQGSSIAAAGPDGLTLLSTRTASVLTSTGQNILLVWGVLIAGLVILQLFRLGGSLAVRSNSRFKPLRNYQMPAELTAAVRNQRCAVFAGEDLCPASGLPAWNAFTRQLFDWMHDLNLMEEDKSDEIRGLFKAGRTLEAGRRVIEEMSARPALLLEYTRGIYTAGTKPSALHRALSNIAFPRVLTANLDGLLENAMAAQSPEILTPGEHAASEGLQLWKLRGRFDHQNGVTIVPEDAARRQDAQDVLREHLRNYTVLFAGTTADELAAWLEPLPADAFTSKVYAFLLNAPDVEKRLSTLMKKADLEVVLYGEGERERLRELLSNWTRQPVSTPIAAVL